MPKLIWSTLNPLQVGRYAEYFVKMEFTCYGFDVYTSEVDNKGIDFVARYKTYEYYDIQVKSARLERTNYIFMPKTKFALRSNLLLALVLFQDNIAPTLYLIPSTVWQQPNIVFSSRDYEGRKSEPEWGVSLSKRNLATLEPFLFDSTVTKLQALQS